MTDVLFIITTLFVAYVVYVIVNEKRNESAGKKSSVAAGSAPQTLMKADSKPAAPASKAKPAPAAKTTAKPVAEKAAAKPAPAKVSAPKAAAKPAPAKAASVTAAAESSAPKSSGLKDPRTGEVTTSYANYRFTKRWIKEALVAEGLIDKIYKNDELNAAVEAKLKTAIAKLEDMKKYQP